MDEVTAFLTDAEQAAASPEVKALIRRLTSSGEGITRVLPAILRDTLQSDPALQRSAKELLLTLLIFVLFYALIKAAGGRITKAVGGLLSFFVSAAAALPLYRILSDAMLLQKEINSFFGVFVPVAGGLLACGGAPVSAAAFHTLLTVLLSALQILLALLLPRVILLFYLFALSGPLFADEKIEKTAKYIKDALFSALAAVTSLFAIVIGMQTLVCVKTDSLSGKALRHLVTKSVPIVGSTIGESLHLIGGGLIAVKNSVGVAAACFFLGLFVPMFLRLWFFSFFLGLADAVCDAGGLPCRSFFVYLRFAFQFCMAASACQFALCILNVGVFLSIPTVVASS